MDRIQIYRTWYAQESAANEAMLGMIASVPIAQRSDPRFEQAVQLAHHLAACRENWLDRMTAGGFAQTAWWPEGASVEALAPRFVAIEERWTSYLEGLTDPELDVDFEFPATATHGYRWNIEGQIMQMVGHAFYHRGQIALLVDQLGGETVDTDYLYWAFQQRPDRWHALPNPDGVGA